MELAKEIDLGQHLGLVYRVIHQLGLRGDQADEAFSEGLVALTEASNSYDAAKGPLVNWLANNVRWSLKSWLYKERRNLYLFNNVETDETKQVDIVDKNIDVAKTYELKEILLAVETHLTPIEKEVILLGAIGFSGQEIAKRLNLSPVAISRAKKKAREKLEKFR